MQEAAVGGDDGVGEVALGGLQLQDFLFDRVAGNEAIGEEVASLADAMGPVHRLGLDIGPEFDPTANIWRKKKAEKPYISRLLGWLRGLEPPTLRSTI